MNNNQILKEANRILLLEKKGISSLSKIFNQKFVQLIKKLLLIKGRVIITGIGKSGHIAKKYQLLYLLQELHLFLFIHQKQVMAISEC